MVKPGLLSIELYTAQLEAMIDCRYPGDRLALADLVTCSTDALRRYATHGRVAVLRNCVPERYLSITAKRTGQTVGWGGAAASRY